MWSSANFGRWQENPIHDVHAKAGRAGGALSLCAGRGRLAVHPALPASHPSLSLHRTGAANFHLPNGRAARQRKRQQQLHCHLLAGEKKKRKAAGKKGGKAGAIYFRANVNSRPGRGETARLGRAGPDGARRRGNAERRTRVETETCRWGPAGSGEAGGGAGVRGRRSGGCEKKSSAGVNDDDGGDGERGIRAGTTKARAHRTPHTAHT